MKIEEARGLLDSFVAFANVDVGHKDQLFQHFVDLFGHAEQLEIYINMPYREIEGYSENARKKAPNMSEEEMLSKIYEYQFETRRVLEKISNKEILRTVLRGMLIYDPSDNSAKMMFVDYDDDQFGIKKESLYSISSALCLIIFLAEAKGVCRCEACGKHIIKYTKHDKKTCSAACRQKKRRAKLRQKGE